MTGLDGPLGRYFCRRCADEKGAYNPASERYAMRIYAGMYCDVCWEQDGRNNDRDFDPDDAGESMEPDYGPDEEHW